MSAQAKFESLQLTLPPAPKPVGVYKPVVLVGNLVYTSGHGPLQVDGKLMVGKVGADVDQAYGYDAARQTGLALLASLIANLGSLDRVKRVVKTLGMVNCTPTFTNHPAVINGCSELFAEIWGPDAGVGARSAVGLNALPANMTTEVEVIFELHDA
jgi:enamine deaminase RidA (YjgF/YER057c/UK114 family)